MNIPDGAVSFDHDAFDDLIHANGVQMVHWRAMRCPVGLVDPDDIRRPHEHHMNCSNGFVYTLAGQITCGFMANSKEISHSDPGRLDGSTVQVVFPRFYDDECGTPGGGERTEFAKYDRMYLKEEAITVPTWQTYRAHISGYDRLMFPVVTVTDIMDSDGKRYVNCVDYCIENGQIKWLGANQPGVDAKTGLGKVVSVRFRYRPFWYVKSLPHEVRVAVSEDDITGARTLQRMPQSALLQREYTFEKEERDSQQPGKNNPHTGETGGPDSPRQQPGPSDGLFGPR